MKTVEEKTNIANDIKTLQNLHNDFTSKIADLNLKYEHLCKNKSLMKLDLEKMKKEKERKEKEIKKLQEEINNLDIKNKKKKYQEMKKFKFYHIKRQDLEKKFHGQVILEIIYFYCKILLLLIASLIKLEKL